MRETFDDIANRLSKALGREVKYISVPMDAARESMVGMGMPAWVAEAYCEYFENYCQGGSASPTDDFEKLTGHAPRSYEIFARDFAPYFQAAGSIKQDV